jgi:monoamine oxidase
LSDLGRHAVATELSHNNGVSIERQSYLGNLSQVKGGGLEAYWTDSEIYRCRGGNQQLARKLATEIGSDRIHLNAPVASIEITDSGVRVTTAGGEVFEGEEVILSTTPTVWNKIAISPALPGKLMPQMGTSVKYLAQVKSRFWYPQGVSQYVFSDAEAGLTWEATDAQAGDTDIVHTSFSSGEVANRHRGRSPEERDAAMKEAMELVLPGYSAQFVRSRFMNWPSDEWTQGGYSFPAPGEVTTVGPMLREGMPRLHFAGEHTCYKFVGYMEGGLNSGASLARRIAERDGKA